MRIVLPLAAALLLVTAAVAQAQVTPPGTAAPPGAAPPDAQAAPAPAKPHHPHMTLRERFEAANISHDGHLTPEQAQASWPSVAKHFAEIDTGHQGYVTLDEVRTWRAAHRKPGAPASPGQPPSSTEQ